jgi:hypothetical protein
MSVKLIENSVNDNAIRYFNTVSGKTLHITKTGIDVNERHATVMYHVENPDPTTQSKNFAALEANFVRGTLGAETITK